MQRMRFINILVLLCCIVFSAEADAISLNFGDPTSNHHVLVGNSETMLFEPDHLNANIGDRITFHFRTLNHTLTQSTLHNPCLVTHQFDASFHQFNPTEGHELVLTLTVDSVDPRWYFCKQTHPISHCHVGMIFAINPGEHMGEFRKNTRKASSLSGPFTPNCFTCTFDADQYAPKRYDNYQNYIKKLQTY
ncbi:uncharacterized protein N7469_009747 [Penicillium citrinum]|uniref:Plastocyanin-like domain-containing protein n=1 Tax=Penicillium citrinum TaxID=5077 RepID=A0A9W9NIZ4_PENCI|nr:uncharacterized protein N7469_009747 [Penicillium citrinum]KAJ5220860.1 hypothetical protein N7469_009747 [Penicillium citrinum]